MNYLQYLMRAGVPEQYHEAALLSLADSESRAKKVAPYKLKAPFVMAKLVFKLPRDAQELPASHWPYDNEKSINGDGWGKLVDGEWKTFRVNNEPGCIPYTDPEWGGPAYYLDWCKWIVPAKWRHPWGKFARWWWLGVRNRASRFAYILGAEKSADWQYWGDIETSKAHEGVVVYRMGEHWQIYACEMHGPFVVRRNVGVKINNAINDPSIKRAMVVSNKWTLLRKGQE